MAYKPKRVASKSGQHSPRKAPSNDSHTEKRRYESSRPVPETDTRTEPRRESFTEGSTMIFRPVSTNTNQSEYFDDINQYEDYSERTYFENEDIKRGSHIPCVIISVILVILMGALCTLLAISKMVPLKLLIPVGLIMMALLLIVILLTRSTAKKVPFIIGIILAVLIAAASVYAGVAIYKVMDTMRTISETTEEASTVNVYVLNEDPAQELVDAMYYDFGILEVQDRNATDQAISNINGELGMTISYDGYLSIPELITSLREGNTGAIILNGNYLSLMSDISGYEDIKNELRQIATISVTRQGQNENQSQPVATHDGNTFITYISGTDSRIGLGETARSDVNILAIANVDTRQMLLLNTPRDYFIPFPNTDGERDKLTHAGLYGIDISIGALEMLYDIDVNYFLRVDFSGFENIVDALGGISVYSKYTFTSDNGRDTDGNTYSYYEGYNDMSGGKALAFVRERYSLPGGDNDRGQNQMEVIKGIVKKAMSPEILYRYSDLLTALEGCFETTISYDTMAEVVNDQLSSGSNWNVVSYAVTGTGNSLVTWTQGVEAYVTEPDYDSVQTAIELIDTVFTGGTLVEPEPKQ